MVTTPTPINEDAIVVREIPVEIIFPWPAVVCTLLTGTLLLLIRFFYLPLFRFFAGKADYLVSFAWGLLAVTLVWAFWYFIANVYFQGWVTLPPLLLNLVFLALAWVLPFNELWRQRDFNLNYARRAHIAQLVVNEQMIMNTDERGKIIPTKLPGGSESLSSNGEVYVKHAYLSSSVLFFTYRTAGEYAGFEYRDRAEEPETYHDGETLTRVTPLSNGWWYVEVKLNSLNE